MSLPVLIVVVVILFLAIWVHSWNPEPLTFHLTKTRSFESNVVTLFVASIFVGALAVGALNLTRGFQEKWRQWRRSVGRRRAHRAEDLHHRAELYLRAGECAEAEGLLRRAIEQDPRHVPSLVALGRLLREAGATQEATQLHSRAAAIQTNDPAILFELALDHEHAESLDSALQVLARIDRSGADRKAVLRKRRDLLCRVSRWAEALEVQREILAGGHDRGDRVEQARLLQIQHEMARVEWREGNAEASIKEWRRILKADPGVLPAYLALGEVYIEQGKRSEAERIWEEGYDKTGAPVLLSRLEDLYVEQDQPNRVIEMYQNALMKRADDPFPRLLLAKVYLRFEMLEQAREELERLSETHGALAEVQALLLQVHNRMGNLEQALAACRLLSADAVGTGVPYQCGSCGADAPQWQESCPHCGAWNSLSPSRHDQPTPAA